MKNVGFAERSKNAGKAEDTASVARAILPASGDDVRSNPVRTNADTNDAGLRSASDDILEQSERVRFQSIQGNQAPDEIRAQCRREERLLALRKGQFLEQTVVHAHFLICHRAFVQYRGRDDLRDRRGNARGDDALQHPQGEKRDADGN